MWPVSAEAATCQIDQLRDCCQQLKDFFLHFKVSGLHRGTTWNLDHHVVLCHEHLCCKRGLFFTLYFVTAKSWEGIESRH